MHANASSSSSSSFEENNQPRTQFAPLESLIPVGRSRFEQIEQPDTPRFATPDSSNIASMLSNDSRDAMEGRHTINGITGRIDSTNPHDAHNANNKKQCCDIF